MSSNSMVYLNGYFLDTVFSAKSASSITHLLGSCFKGFFLAKWLNFVLTVFVKSILLSTRYKQKFKSLKNQGADF